MFSSSSSSYPQLDPKERNKLKQGRGGQQRQQQRQHNLGQSNHYGRITIRPCFALKREGAAFPRSSDEAAGRRIFYCTTFAFFLSLSLSLFHSPFSQRPKSTERGPYTPRGQQENRAKRKG